MVAANSSKVSRAPLYLGYPLGDRCAFAYGAITRFGWPFQTLPLTLDFVTPCRTCRSDLWLPRPPACNACKLTHTRFGLLRVRSPLLPESLLFSFPVGTEMVHFPTLPSLAYGFSQGYPGMSLGGLPHSEIAGSKLVCSSPALIAAYHVLHRLLAPRHSPYALSSLTIG